jgi:hypothetical protein
VIAWRPKRTILGYELKLDGAGREATAVAAGALRGIQTKQGQRNKMKEVSNIQAMRAE